MLVINNVKFHTRIYGPRKKVYHSFYKDSKSPHITKRRRSFIILRLEKIVYTCFENGFINITGVRDLSFIPKAIHQLAFYLGIATSDFSIPVTDNLHASCHLPPTCINLKKLAEILSHANCKELKELRYNRQRFPGLTARTDSGSILWFASNRVLLTGCRTELDLRLCQEVVKDIFARWISAVAI